MKYAQNLRRSGLSAVRQLLAALFAAAAAVALPQLVHLISGAAGHGTMLGEMLLPMHLPVIAVGLIAGPVAGVVAGLAAPIVSYLLCGMPLAAMVPFIAIELCTYGLLAGLLKSSGMPVLCKVLLVQVGGRAVRAAAILFSVYGLHHAVPAVSVIWTSIATGALGIALQWILIPLLVKGMQRLEK